MKALALILGPATIDKAFAGFTFDRLAAAFRVWEERRALARLDKTMLADLGLTEAQAAREAGRSLWDLPAGR